MNRIAFTTATLAGSFRDKARAMGDAGFTATELWAKDLFDDYEGPEVALRALHDNGLAVCALQALRNIEGCGAGERARKLDIARRVMDLACLAGSPLVTLAANVQPGADGGTQHIVDDLGALAGEAALRGLRIAYEPVAWAPHVSHWRRALELITAVDHPALGLQLDVFHAFVRGDAAIALQDIPAPRLFLVEVSDFAPSRLTPLEMSRGYRLFPGEGTLPLQEFAAALRRHGYGGDVVVEVFNAAYLAMPAPMVAQRGRDSMQTLMGITP